uniref:Down syndrome cell adhesion molecule-like protein 1 n=3 Tax=Cacopsylla melanoneura TaxID=428564 RepID=A0A8D9FBG5_9HEMI
MPKVQPFSFGDTPFEAGETTSVQCLVSSGDLPLSISWLFNNASIPSTSGLTVSRLTSRTSVLTIESVSHTHVGRYACLATNVAGSSLFESSLLVNGLLFGIISQCFLKCSLFSSIFYFHLVQFLVLLPSFLSVDLFILLFSSSFLIYFPSISFPNRFIVCFT